MLVEPIELELGFRLIRLANPEVGGDLMDRVTNLRHRIALELGIILPKSVFAVVIILDAAGREVRHLHEGNLPEGRTNLWWDGHGDNGTRLAAGTYWYRLKTDRSVDKRKVILLR